MRKTVIAGNWKMNKNLSEAAELVNGLKAELAGKTLNVGVIVCPPYVNIESVAKLAEGTEIKVGAQNMYFEESGAYTGEISADMLKSVGAEYVILGHSERRTIFGENDEVINKKMKKALEAGLKPIFCIGETLEEREGGTMKEVIAKQVKGGLSGISEQELSEIIVAYEPVWAIGTGVTASPDQAQEVHAYIRGMLKEMYSEVAADNMTIQYGGSVKPGNAKELLGMPDIDGALVGGACLKADSFAGIITAV
ncbi:MAG: triosephosphate isomerase [Melioribacteraceae bacterium]|nr:MAG: triosephosphate isomerase [Melioribacteraceae bacterium]